MGPAWPLPMAARRASDLRIAQLLVAHVYDVAPEAVSSRSRRGPRVIEARQVAMYLCHVELGMPITLVARRFGRDRATARLACRHVEELREDPSRDRLLALLESLLRQAVGLRSVCAAVLS